MGAEMRFEWYCLWAISCSCCGLLSAQAAPHPAEITHSSLGCVNPDIASLLASQPGLRESDPAAFQQNFTLGECRPVSSGAGWQVASAGHEGVIYLRRLEGKQQAEEGGIWVLQKNVHLLPLPVERHVDEVPTPPISAIPQETPAESVPPEKGENLEEKQKNPPQAVPMPSSHTHTAQLPTRQQAAPEEALTVSTALPLASETPAPSSSSNWLLGLVLVLGGAGLFLLFKAVPKTRKPPSHSFPSPNGGQTLDAPPLSSSAMKASAPMTTAVPPSDATSPTNKAPETRPLTVEQTVEAGSIPDATEPSSNSAPTSSAPPLARSAFTPPSSTAYLNKPNAQWVPPGEALTVQGTVISDGMVWFTDRPDAWPYPEPCVINRTLPVSGAGSQSMGYWPSYGQITPSARGVYLHWLAEGRTNPHIGIGYVFLFFYGLEKRLLIDTPPPEEVAVLLAELHRLRELYAYHASFNRYSKRLIEAASLRHLGFDQTELANLTVPEPEQAVVGWMSLGLKMALAQHVLGKTHIPFDLAASGLIGLEEMRPFRQVLDYAREPFLTLLQEEFAKQLPKGFLLRNRQRSNLRYLYQGAMSGLRVDIPLPAQLENAPDPATLNWNPMLRLALPLAEKLQPYAKLVSRYPARAQALKGALLMPPELRGTIAQEAQEWLISQGTLSAVPIKVLGRQVLGIQGKNWTRSWQVKINDVLTELGYGMEPNPALNTRTLEDTTEVYLYAAPPTGASRAFDVAVAGAMMASRLATQEDSLPKAEIVDRWAKLACQGLGLPATQAPRLRAIFLWYQAHPATLARAMKLLGDGTRLEREFCALSVVVAALAHAPVDKQTIAGLEALHDKLNIDRNALYRALHSGSVHLEAPAEEEPVLAQSAVAPTGHAIPAPPAALAPAREDTTFQPVAPSEDDLATQDAQRVAEAARLAQLRAETAQVAGFLAEVLQDDEPEPEPEAETNPASEAPSETPTRWPGLDVPHTQLLERLLTQEEWTQEAFEEQARAVGLLPGGALETLNEWAYDTYDEALLEDEGTIRVMKELLA